MEVATILIGVAVFIISALMIYCISAVSMREKTFEEVIAEQREQQEREREKAKAEKKAEKDQVKKKGFKKGKQEKVKEKSAQVNEPELKGEHKMVNLEIEPEVIEPTETAPLSAGVRQRSGKKEKAKSILINKDEPTMIAKKAVELHHKPNVPKDEMELKKSHEKVAEKAPSTDSPKKEAKAKISTETKENLPPKGVAELKDVKQKHREEERVTSKTKQVLGDAPLTGSRLVAAVKAASLSDNEVQSLIDILLNRQGLTPTGPMATESWNKKSQKGDPVSIMKKQLEEKERLLQEEKNNAVGLMSRTKEMKNELTAEKTKSASLEKRYQEQLAHQTAEVEALKSRMQHTHEQHMRETNSLQSRLHQMESGGDRAAAQKLSDENKILQETLTLKSKESISLGEKIKQLERELNNSLNKVKASDSAKKDFESKTKTYEDKIRKLESMQQDVSVMVNQKVEEVTHELRSSETRNVSLTNELSVTQGELTSLKAKLQELESHLTKADASKETGAKLQESERKCSDLERNVKNLEKQLSDLSQRFDGSSTELQRLQQENKSLADTNKIMKEKLQNAPANTSNGNAHDNSLSVEEHERILSEKVKEVETQKKSSVSLQAQLDTKAAEVENLQAQLAKKEAKNNELREKNWKAMEALEQSEKSASEKVEKAMKSARESNSSADVENYDKSVFQGLFPEIKVTGKMAHKEWVAAFQKQAEKKISSYPSVEKTQKLEAQVADYEKQLSKLQSKASLSEKLEEENKQLRSAKSSASNVDSGRISQLEGENKSLQSELDHFRGIVTDTESKLRQLEKSIDEEEKKWHEKLKNAREEGQKGNVSSQRVSELEALVSEQESQMQEYRNVLSMTEDKLKELEKKIGAKEKVWHTKLSAAQSELSQTKSQFASLKQELNASQGSQEMKTKVESLEKELKEAQDKITVITKEKETVLVQYKEVQKKTSSAGTSSSSQEVSELRSQLETERKKNKDLSMNVVKLNGIIKTGQDALTQEQGLVKKLQQSLDTKSMSSGISDIDEADQASSSNENGTSV